MSKESIVTSIEGAFHSIEVLPIHILSQALSIVLYICINSYSTPNPLR